MPRLPRIRTELALATRGKVGGWLDGIHPSVHAGRSLEFHDVREYVRGDDPSDIDWKASARLGTLLVQRHVARRRTTVLLAVDSGRGMAALASPGLPKRALALDAAATLASLAFAGGDHVGILHAIGGSAVSNRPSARPVRVERMLRAVEDAITPDADDADLPALLERTSKSWPGRGIVGLVLGDVEVDQHLEALLRRLSVQHAVLVVVVPDLDPTDPTLRRALVGVDDGRAIPAELVRDRELAAAWRHGVEDRARRRTTALAHLAIPSITLRAQTRVVPQMLSWLRSVRHAQ